MSLLDHADMSKRSHPRPCAWITGARGLIGHRLLLQAPTEAPEWDVIGLTRENLELTDRQAVEAFFRESSPDLIIHCAAASRSPWCEAHPRLAYEINVNVTRHLAELASDLPFLLLSSDLVFDGSHGNYTETDSVNPLSVYGETKAEAEHAVLANPRHTVVRTSLNAGRSPDGNRAFNEGMERAWQSGERLHLFKDEFRSPIPADVTARALWQLIRVGSPGLYHLAGTERLSRLQIGQLLARLSQAANPQIIPTSIRDFDGPPRPPDTSLNCAKIQTLLPFPLPKFSEWVASSPKLLQREQDRQQECLEEPDDRDPG